MKEKTLQDLLIDYQNKINNCIEEVNKSSVIIQELKNKDVSEEIINEIKNILNNDSLKIDGGKF